VILNNKFGEIFIKQALDLYFKAYDDLYIAPIGGVISEIFPLTYLNKEKDTLVTVQDMLKGDDEKERIIAMLGLMNFAFKEGKSFRKYETAEIHIDDNIVGDIFEVLYTYMLTEDDHCIFSASWCIAWYGRNLIFPELLVEKYVENLLRLWINKTEYNMNRMISWAISSLIKPNLNVHMIKKIQGIEVKINECVNDPKNDYDRFNCVCIGSLLGYQYDVELVKRTLKNPRFDQDSWRFLYQSPSSSSSPSVQSNTTDLLNASNADSDE
jgi:hypothetical protein